MAVIGRVVPRNQKSGESKNYCQKCLKEDLLQARRPSTKKGVTIFRPIPQVHEDGSILPMVVNKTASGYDFSALDVENVIINQGKDARFTAFAKPSDRPSLDEDELPWSTMFIRLRGRQKAKEIPSDLVDRVDALFERKKDVPAPLEQVREMVLCQAVLLQFNDKRLEKPLGRQCMFLSVSAVQAMNETLSAAWDKGVDVFSPENGRAIHLVPKAQRGSGIIMYECELGDKIPLSEDRCRKLWTPWQDAKVFHDNQTHFQRLCSCYGRDIVEYVFGPREVADALGEAPPPSQPSQHAVGYERPPVEERRTQEAPRGAQGEMQLELEIDDSLSTDIEGADEDDSTLEPGEAGGPDDVDYRPPSDAGSAGSTASGPEDAEALARHFESQLDND